MPHEDFEECLSDEFGNTKDGLRVDSNKKKPNKRERRLRRRLKHGESDELQIKLATTYRHTLRWSWAEANLSPHAWHKTDEWINGLSVDKLYELLAFEFRGFSGGGGG